MPSQPQNGDTGLPANTGSLEFEKLTGKKWIDGTVFSLQILGYPANRTKRSITDFFHCRFVFLLLHVIVL